MNKLQAFFSAAGINISALLLIALLSKPLKSPGKKSPAHIILKVFKRIASFVFKLLKMRGGQSCDSFELF